MPSPSRRSRGHSSVKISERYIYPIPKGQERVFERFADLNKNLVKHAKTIKSGYNFSYTPE